MGRYFQHASWPGTDQEFPQFDSLVPDSEISFHSSGGVHLLLLAFAVENASLAVFTARLLPRLDGTILAIGGLGNTIPVAAFRSILYATLIEIPAGPHLLDCIFRGTATDGETLNGGSGRLIVIEFPSWESSDRIEGP